MDIRPSLTDQEINAIENRDEEAMKKHLRTKFAGQAMQGILSNPKTILFDIDDIKKCVKIADSLIAELEK